MTSRKHEKRIVPIDEGVAAPDVPAIKKKTIPFSIYMTHLDQTQFNLKRLYTRLSGIYLEPFIAIYYDSETDLYHIKKVKTFNDDVDWDCGLDLFDIERLSIDNTQQLKQPLEDLGLSNQPTLIECHQRYWFYGAREGGAWGITRLKMSLTEKELEDVFMRYKRSGNKRLSAYHALCDMIRDQRAHIPTTPQYIVKSHELGHSLLKLITYMEANPTSQYNLNGFKLYTHANLGEPDKNHITTTVHEFVEMIAPRHITLLTSSLECNADALHYLSRAPTRLGYTIKKQDITINLIEEQQLAYDLIHAPWDRDALWEAHKKTTPAPKILGQPSQRNASVTLYITDERSTLLCAQKLAYQSGIYRENTTIAVEYRSHSNSYEITSLIHVLPRENTRYRTHQKIQLRPLPLKHFIECLKQLIGAKTDIALCCFADLGAAGFGMISPIMDTLVEKLQPSVLHVLSDPSNAKDVSIYTHRGISIQGFKLPEKTRGTTVIPTSELIEALESSCYVPIIRRLEHPDYHVTPTNRAPAPKHHWTHFFLIGVSQPPEISPSNKAFQPPSPRPMTTLSRKIHFFNEHSLIYPEFITGNKKGFMSLYISPFQRIFYLESGCAQTRSITSYRCSLPDSAATDMASCAWESREYTSETFRELQIEIKNTHKTASAYKQCVISTQELTLLHTEFQRIFREQDEGIIREPDPDIQILLGLLGEKLENLCHNSHC